MHLISINLNDFQISVLPSVLFLRKTQPDHETEKCLSAISLGFDLISTII